MLPNLEVIKQRIIFDLSITTKDMKQINQIGKYTKKESVLQAKNGKTFVTPKNRNYIFSYVKHGNKYIFCIEFKGYKMHLPESDFNKSNVDDLLDIMENGINVK